MILERIITHKKEEIARQRKLVPLSALKKRLPSSKKRHAFKNALSMEGIGLIAEVKKASPSKGILRHDFDPVQIASCYEANGAAAVSILTDEAFFQGSPVFLEQVSKEVGLPLLRKDFIIDPYQIFEACVLGADAVLLIAAVLERKELAGYIRIARELGMDALVETHSRSELETVLEAGAEIIGINNRDLRTFETNLQTTLELAELIPQGRLLVSESGIATAGDIRLLADAGVDAVLVGEALITSPRMADKVRELAGR